MILLIHAKLAKLWRCWSETSRLYLAKIVDLKSPNKSMEATSSTSTLGDATKQRQWCWSDRYPNCSNCLSHVFTK
jgi:hypothetical protein